MYCRYVPIHIPFTKSELRYAAAAPLSGSPFIINAAAPFLTLQSQLGDWKRRREYAFTIRTAIARSEPFAYPSLFCLSPSYILRIHSKMSFDMPSPFFPYQ